MSEKPDHIGENAKERKRLVELTSRLTERELSHRLPNGWTVAVTLAHLAFWDQRQATLLRRLTQRGIPPDSANADTINEALSVLFQLVPPGVTVKMAVEAAEAIDGEVERVPPAMAEEILRGTNERLLRRSLHRRDHLDKIEKALKSVSK